MLARERERERAGVASQAVATTKNAHLSVDQCGILESSKRTGNTRFFHVEVGGQIDASLF